ncbi:MULTISPECIES: hypothetical protein [unclassified Streptomyces]|uniref:hypothetical protein n=1 Tax=unclassified Streptomyces TaxID=2593676 RepID=UPI0038284331
MTPTRDTHATGRRRPRLGRWFAPRGSRTFVLGICVAVGGISGSIRGAMDGTGILEVAGLLGLGILGVALTIRYVVLYAREK